MSFALEYRRKRIAREAEAARAKAPREEGYAAPPPRRKAETARNRVRGLVILVVAAAVLGLFNSGSLVGRTQSLHETSIGRELIVASEKWHSLMEAGKLTVVVDSIRGMVADFRDASWQDVAEYFTPEPQAPDAPRPPAPAGPAEAAAVPAAQDPAKLLRGSVAPEAEDEEPGTAREGPLKSVQAERTDY